MDSNKSPFSFPYVSMRKAVAFNYDKPETWTQSRIVNAVVEALSHVRPFNRHTVAAYLGISAEEVNLGLMTATGKGYQEFVVELRKLLFQKTVAEQPSIAPKQMANVLGYASQGALWAFLTKHKLIEPVRRRPMRERLDVSYVAKQTFKGMQMGELRRLKWRELTKNCKGK